MDTDLPTPPPPVSRRRGDSSDAITEQLQRLRDLEDHLVALSGPTRADQAGEDADHVNGPQPEPVVGARPGLLPRRWRRRS